MILSNFTLRWKYQAFGQNIINWLSARYTPCLQSKQEETDQLFRRRRNVYVAIAQEHKCRLYTACSPCCIFLSSDRWTCWSPLGEDQTGYQNILNSTSPGVLLFALPFDVPFFFSCGMLASRITATFPETLARLAAVLAYRRLRSE